MKFEKTINGMTLMFERQELAPNVFTYLVSVKGDPAKFPMVHKKEYGGWFFVDKMTPIDFMQMEKEISLAIQTTGG